MSAKPIIKKIKQNKQNFLSLIIHLPSNHMRKINVTASVDWTLSDVFSKTINRLANEKNNQLESDYVRKIFIFI